MPNIKNNTNTKVVINDIGFEAANLEFEPNETKFVFAQDYDRSYELKALLEKGILIEV